MSIVVMGLSHRSTPLDVLESAALDTQRAARLADAVLAGDNVGEAVVVATCNRLEVYAGASTFHGAVDEISAALVEASGLSRAALAEHAYVHYEDRAIAHAFEVACGLDSMAVGEPQILGQLRGALEEAQGRGHVGAELNALLQRALRVGKRAHSETGLDHAGPGLVAEGLAAAAEHVGAFTGADVLVVGAGAMSGLAATTVARLRPASLTVVNRTPDKAERLAASLGARTAPWADLPAALAAADVVVTCTGALGHVLDRELVEGALAADATRSARDGRPRAFVDLALPRDVDPDVARLPGVVVISLAELGERFATRDAGDELAAVRDLVTGEVAAYLVDRRAQEVGPTVAALRARASDVVEAELARLEGRLGGLDDHQRDEVARTMRRVADKLLHTPTVRVKELAGNDSGDYAQALRDLFDLCPGQATATSTPPPPGVTR